MKKIFVMVVFLLFPVVVKAYSARNIIAMDMDTNRVLYGESIHDQHLIASITKIMTAIVAIENGNLEELVEINDVVLKSFGSGIYVEVGEKISLKDLLYGLMLRSGNDAALAIADYVGGNVEDFVRLMNLKAGEIGMKNTQFINPHGLENNKGEGNLSTAYDMALLSSYAMQNERYQEIVKTKNYVAKSDKKTYSWTNKNKLLNTYEYTTGGKTGFTEKARRTLVSTASKDDKNVTIVTLNDGNDWADHETLYESVFNSYDNVLVLDKNNFKIDKENYYKDELYIREDVSVLLKEEEKKEITLTINLRKLEDYEDQTVVGTVEIKLKDTILKVVNVYIRKNQEETKKESLFRRIIGWFKHD
ncbi:MAG: D-alanyl-D-alanine carboxypeptidase [Bacilli bacterium]|nr:D-alanyl-D-alanine carboxypeptidase [Bacilli bacterium]